MLYACTLFSDGGGSGGDDVDGSNDGGANGGGGSGDDRDDNRDGSGSKGQVLPNAFPFNKRHAFIFSGP